MYTLINGSQKNHYSNSKYFLERIAEDLDEYQLLNIKTDNINNIIDSISKSEVLVLAFPLYVDSPNTITLELLDYIIDNNIDLNNKKIYTVINCGFREGKHNITALNIVKAWCKRTNAIYSGSLLIGAGEVVGREHYKFICRKALKKLNEFSLNIKNKESANDNITTMDLLNNKIYSLIANYSWYKQAINNGLSREDILDK